MEDANRMDRWIGYPYAGFELQNLWRIAPHLRRTVHLPDRVRRAVVRICGLGYYELRVNGTRVGDQVLQPPFTRYDATVLYDTFDVADLLVPGENVFAVVLGNGMYNMTAENPWEFHKAPWRHQPKLCFDAVLVDGSGKETVVAGDTAWKASYGPIVGDNLYFGERYDARLEMPGWDRPGFDDSDWKAAAICKGPGGALRPMDMEPCRVVRRLPPVDRWEVRPGVWVFDFGLNLVGWAALQVEGPAGTCVSLKFAEKLDARRDLDSSNIDIFVEAEHFQKDLYTLKGGGPERWEPRFTYHGFQYVRMEGYPGVPGLDALEACEVHTDLAERGAFRCSDPLLDRIQAAARLSTLGNYHGMPTDCPHREKNGWTGDTALSAEQVLLNLQPDRAYRKWLRDIVDCQRPNGQLPGIVPTGGWGYNWGSGPAWDSVIVLLPWYLYLYRGDEDCLSTYYPAMRRYLDFLGTMAEGHIAGFGLGDWCPPEGGPEDYKCPLAVVETALYALLAQRVADTAHVLGDVDGVRRYRLLAEDIAQAFRTAFIDDDTGVVSGDSQTSYASALYADLVHGALRDKVAARLVESVERADRHIDCGILGTKFLLHVLTDIGRTDLAFAIATQTTFPGWGHWIGQGATTLWETWKGDASRNHHMFSDISAWFYRCLAGIRPDPQEPGFRHVLVTPHPVPGLTWVEARHEAPSGTIAVHWRAEGDDLFTLDLEIPENSHATLRLPCTDASAITERGVSLNGRIDLRLIGQEADRTILSVLPGTYALAAPWK